MVKVLFLGDIVGKPGRAIATKAVPGLRIKYRIDLVVANAENAAGGSGLDARSYKQLRAGGIDAFTMGDHVYRHRDIYRLFNDSEPVCRPANYPHNAPGPDHIVVTTDQGMSVGIINVMGRTFMKPVDCYMRAVDSVLERLRAVTNLILVDIHAEATSDKQILARFVDGRVSLVVGTHTHVPTADACVLPEGTGYITDLGMTGPYDSVIGRRTDRVTHATYSFEPKAFEVATGDPRVSGVLADLDPTSGRTRSIELLHLDEAAIADLPSPLAVT